MKRLEIYSCRIALVLLVLVLAGCAAPTLKPEDCALGAWYAVGHVDGLEGKDSRLLVQHKKACARYDIEIDSSEYMDGYIVGNKTYCDNYDHYGAAVVGNARVNVCPGEPYSSQHRAGNEVYCKAFDHYGTGKDGQPFNNRCSDFPYRQEYNKGLAIYCASTNPYELARSYGSYAGVCNSDFDRAYKLGERSLVLEDRIDDTQRELEDQLRSLIDEEDPDRAKLLREQIKLSEEQLKEQRKQLIELKIQVRDLGYLDSDDVLDDLIDLVI